MDSQPGRPDRGTVIYPASVGEVQRLIEEKDWSQTPLGPRAQWSQSLKTALSIALSSRFPMLIWWGKQLCALYNDAYIPIFAKKHPDVLGKPGFEVWGEVWDVIGPMLEAVVERGDTTWSRDELLELHRKGFVEETYFTWSYSPIADETGGVGGVFTSVIETTERILSERRLKVLRDAGQSASRATSVSDAWREAARIAGQDRADLPFVLLYAAADAHAELAAWEGIEPDHPAAAPRLPLDAQASWPFAQVLRTSEPVVLEDVRARFGELRSSWPEPVERAAVMSLPSGDPARPLGFAVLGLSPRLAFDDNYRSFTNLLASQIGSAVANALAYEQERKRAEALAEVDRAKTAFFSNVSHEFRTPLTLMLGPTEDALASPERALNGEALETVHRNELRLLKLVNTLLEFSRIEAGRLQASYEPVDLAAFTRDLASTFRSAIERGGMRFDVDCAPLPEPVWVDPEMWEKIVLNLLSNAFKFSFEGSIRIALSKRQDFVELEVLDTGVGIPAAEVPRLFERFHRVEGARSRTHEGSGIGLALVNDLVKLHGGETRVASEVGRGTRFTVSIPLGNAHLPSERVRSRGAAQRTPQAANAFVAEALRWLPGAPEPARLPAAHEPARARVLVADDNADMRDYMRRLLEPHWQVEAVADGNAALEAARRDKPELILTDVMMPGLDGFAFLRELRADPELQSLPVIMLSARAGEAARVEGLQAGADDYLVKPFSARELIARVGNLVKAVEERRLVDEERVRTQQLLAQLPAVVNFLRGPDLVFEFAHPTALEIWGGRALAGRPLFEAIPELREGPYAAMLERVLKTGETLSLKEGRLDLVRNGKSEETYWSSVYQPVRAKGGSIEGVMTFAMEVTEQVLARRGLEAANRTKDEFLAVLGHELRNPLAPIRTALELMRLRGIEQPEHEVIGRQVAQLARLVDDLLDVARVATGKVELRKKPIELAQVINRALEMVEPLVEQRRQRLLVDVPPAGLLVYGDQQRLTQVISNVVVNASKYSADERRIWVSARAADHRISVVVRDEGIGLEASALEEIFQPFVQRQKSLAHGSQGLGLGLAIARNLVVAHGGDITARSDGLGRGSEFLIELPLLESDEAAVHDNGRARPRAAQGPNRTILVVDDNEDAAMLLAEALSAMGHRVDVANDGPAGLLLAAKLRPDIVLLDIGMPVMDGYEVARRLRAADAHEGMKIIAITGFGQASDREKSALRGFDAHLVKPVELDDLLRLVT